MYVVCTFQIFATNHVCVAGIHCPNLTLPNHALVVSDPRSTIAESVVTYGCREGYELNNGSLVLECNLDGHWSDDPPQCTGRLTDMIVGSCKFPINDLVEIGNQFPGVDTSFKGGNL